MSVQIPVSFHNALSVLRSVDISYEVANVLAEPAVCLAYDSDPKKWHFCGADKIPGKDAEYLSMPTRNFEVKVDKTPGTNNLFIETGKAVSGFMTDPICVHVGTLKFRPSGLSVTKDEGVYAVLHAEHGVIFYFNAFKLKEELVKHRVAIAGTGNQARCGHVLPVFRNTRGEIDSELCAKICEKVLRYDSFLDELKEVSLAVTSTPKPASSTTPTRVHPDTKCIAVTASAYKDALARSVDILLVVDGVSRTIPFKNLPTNCKVRVGLPDYVLIHGSCLV